MHWYIGCFKKYFEFDGRAHRKEYWNYTLYNILFSFATSLIGSALGIDPYLNLFYLAATLIPSTAVLVRRLHDTNRSGFNLFWIILPLVGTLILLIYLIREGTEGENSWGSNPNI